ncbi:MAG: hypothetical protein FWC27_09840 [Firmicutes bacterium]|nr:hypothetical protein [Bacillota bacterium]
MTDITHGGNEIIFTQNGEKQQPLRLRLTLAGENLWRLQSAVDGKFIDMGAAQTLAKDLGEPCGSAKLPFEKSQAEHILASFGLTIHQRGENISVQGTLSKDEALFGCGEQFNAANQRGKCVELVAIDKWCGTDGNSYVPIPFIHSTNGYALFLNRYEHSIFDLGAADPGAWEIQLAGAPLDLYIFENAEPAKTLKAYARLTGFAPMPAPWLFGIQVCRYHPDFSTAQGILEMAEAMERNGFPWDAVIAESYPTYDAGRYGELKAVTDRLHAMGKKVMLYEGCARIREYPEYDRSEYMVREPDGNTFLPEAAGYNPEDHPDPRKVRFLDLTNPEAMAWWYDFVWGRLVKEIGVDGCKIDFCEQFPEFLPLQFHDGRDVSGAHHWYPTLYNARMYRYYQENRPEGGMCFSRGGGIGAQRYPFLWAGDQMREWRFLRAQLTGVLSSGLSGIPFMSYDMAGYKPTRGPAEENIEERVFIRGTQMGCFSSNMQTHGTVTRPYDFDEPIKDIYREYAKLHQALRPYLLEQAAISCETGMPLMRHLWLYDPQDKNTWDIEDEYMLGCALLVAPVFEDATRRDIYLPKGQWRGLFDGVIYEGGRILKGFEAPFSRVPVFVLEGHGSESLTGVLEDAEGIVGRIAAMER